jgi:hypothetical protein
VADRRQLTARGQKKPAAIAATGLVDQDRRILMRQSETD